ncbi:TatD family deoxyribonuclease [Coxiella endosymbiont of Amblyomma sculptum]|uniref:TatD family hydrolase n=1 Tax=Coxiella endosymbiont of Amblyomma sculptum TaxID=2487929 RepID=UPI00132F2849|nr:TatD family hydrolase [Coxiella endosymbiont of Amblyomma sculptum]QHG92638.1 TatD family deoxyribonuclease [Coxiella endosymbiont of Amblyomma sculptum]
MLVDSHCHLNKLNLTRYGGKLESLIEKTKTEGIEYILCIGLNLVDKPEIIGITNRFDNVSASLGLHPNEAVQGEHEPTVMELAESVDHANVVSVGETGLDYCSYSSEIDLNTMRDRFRRHIQAAIKVHKPLVIHSRNAQTDTIQIMQEEKAELVGGVVHCFTENLETAKQAINLNFYISFSGIVTFKNAGNVAEVAKQIPLEKMLIETDAPYLTPVPFRGKNNEPQYVRYTAECIAKLKNTSLYEVAKKTTENFYRLFLSNRS